MLNQHEPTVNLSASVPLSVFERVQKVAGEAKMSRSKVIKELIILGLEKYAEQQAAESNIEKGDEK